MLIIFFNTQGIYLSTLHPSPSDYQFRLLLHRSAAFKHPKLKKKWILHHHNAHAHTSATTTTFLVKWKIKTMPHVA